MVVMMDRASLIKAGVDYDDGLARFLGKASLYEKFILQFPEDSTFPALKQALEQGDAQEAFLRVHTLKGVAGNLSFRSFLTVLTPLVEALRANDLKEANLLYPGVEAAYNALCQAIQS